MTDERLQLHSGFGRLQLLLLSTFFWQAIAGVAVAWTLCIAHHQFSASCLLMPVYCVAIFPLSRWARRNATPVFATTAGLELTGPGRVIPWQAVQHARSVSLYGSLLYAYRVTFAGDVPPLTFYACEDVERVIQRFKAATRASK